MSRRGAIGLALVAFALACSQATAPDRPTATVGTSAAWVIEPPTLAIGETATIELGVITPPDRHVAPQAPPDPVAGVWVLRTETPVLEQQRERWVHRFRFQVRARNTGRFVWPEREIDVEGPDETTQVVAAARPFEVSELMPEMPTQRTFFSLRAPAPRREGASPWVPALAGAAATLALIGLVALVRRVRARTAPAATTRLEPPAWRQAQAALAAAYELAESDPVRAADMASAALRLHVSRRFATPALTDTTEELTSRPAPPSAEDRWERVTAVLRALDAVRFLPEAHSRPGADAVRSAVDEAAQLVARDVPRGYEPGAVGGAHAR